MASSRRPELATATASYHQQPTRYNCSPESLDSRYHNHSRRDEGMHVLKLFLPLISCLSSPAEPILSHVLHLSFMLWQDWINTSDSMKRPKPVLWTSIKLL